jgi:5-methylcytosine-specific restriction protein B
MWELYSCIYEPNAESSNSIREPDSTYSLQQKLRGAAVASLNQILYGPPGTGKTYRTIDKALEILDPGFIANVMAEDGNNRSVRAQLKQRFDELTKQGRIHFVTFHQSFSYEDFVEGIKASTSETGISYSVESGIFKKACTACKHIAGVVDLDTALSQFIEEIAEQSITLKTPRGKEFTVFHRGGNTTITCVPHSSEEKRELPASIEHIKQVLKGVRPDNIYCESYVNGIVNHIKSTIPSSGKVFHVGQTFNGYQVSFVSDDIVQLIKPKGNVLPFPMAILQELKKLVESGQITIADIGNKGWQKVESTIEPILVNGYANLVPLLVEHLISGAESVPVQVEESLPTVLIIDEINRGNISSIFGELITLIEPSKRAGAEEALSVTLPYSKEQFQVPGNLYLIGTMNTADRSLALMDTALRRRFDFVEMMPDIAALGNLVVDGIDIATMLTIMNKRIEVLYDREHTLGHAFFMPLLSVADTDQQFATLQNIFANKILPLLEEYFFEDWEKIRLVLGDNQKLDKQDQFIVVKENVLNNSSLFGDDANLDYGVYEAKTYGRNDEALKRQSAYVGIYERKA